MKAVLLDKPGPPSSLRIGEILTPRPGVEKRWSESAPRASTLSTIRWPLRDMTGGDIPTSWGSMSQV
jgi:hypothetical protein